MESINLEQITNLRHRAVIKAVLESGLSFPEIQTALNVTKSNFYSIIKKYLPSNFLKDRKIKMQLNELSTVAQTNNIANVGVQDKVEILSLPSSHEPEEQREDEIQEKNEFKCEQEFMENNSVNSEVTWDKPRYEDQYNLLDYYMTEVENREFPSYAVLGDLIYRIRGKRPSNSDLVIVMNKWKELHPNHPSLKKTYFRLSQLINNQSQNKQQLPQQNRKQDVHIEIGQIKISWSSNSDNVESAIVKIISELKDFVIKQDIKE